MKSTQSYDAHQINGVKIADRSKAKQVPLYTTRPGWKSSGPKPVTSVSEILLEDGRVLHQCDDCFWPAETVHQVVSHRGTKHPKVRNRRNARPSYTPPKQRAHAPQSPSNGDRVAKVVNDSKKGMTSAEIAEAAGLEYKEARYALSRAVGSGKVRRVKRGIYVGKDSTSDLTLDTISANLLQASVILGNLSVMLEKASVQVTALPDDWADVAAKAKKYDELQELLGRR